MEERPIYGKIREKIKAECDHQVGLTVQWESRERGFGGRKGR